MRTARHGHTLPPDHRARDLLVRFVWQIEPLPDVPPDLDTFPEPFRGALAAVLAVPPGGNVFAAFQNYLRTLPSHVATVLQRDVLVQRPPQEQAAAAARRQQQAVPRTYTYDDLRDKDLPPIRWLWDGILPVGSLGLLAGRKKHGKSWLALQLAQAVAADRAFLGRAIAGGDVHYIVLEDGMIRIADRLRRLPELPLTYRLGFSFGPYKPLDQGGDEQLAALLDDEQPRLLVIDTLAAAKGPQIDENDAGQMTMLLKRLRHLCERYGSTILLVAHHGKVTPGQSPGDDVRGSSAISAAVDVIIGLYREDEHRARLWVESRDAPESEMQLQWDETANAWRVIGDSRATGLRQIDDEILDKLDELGEMTAADLARELARRTETVLQSLDKLHKHGLVSYVIDRSRGRGHPRKLWMRAGPRLAEEDAR